MYNEKFFECQLQGRDETITRAVCFSPRKHKIFADYSGKKRSFMWTPLQIPMICWWEILSWLNTIHNLTSQDQRFNLQPRFHQSNLSELASMLIAGQNYQHVQRGKCRRFNSCELYPAWPYSFSQNGIVGESDHVK